MKQTPKKVDISQHNKLKEELAKAKADAKISQDRLRDVFMHAPSMVAIISGPKLIFQLANKPYLQLVGSKEPLEGKTLIEAIPDIEPELLKIVQNVAFKGERFVANELPVILDWDNNGHPFTRYLNLVYEPLFNLENKPNGLICFGYEVTDQVVAAEKMKESEGRYKTLLNSIDQGFCVLEMVFNKEMEPIDYVFLETNKVFEKLTGIKNPVGKNVRSLVPNLEKHWYEIYGKVALTGEPTRFTDASAALGKWFDVSASRLGGKESRKVALLFTDITEQKLVEESLQISEERLRLSLEAGKIGVWDWNIEQNSLTWTPRVYEMHGVSPKDFKVTFSNFKKLIHPDDVNMTKKAILNALEGNIEFNSTFRIVTPGKEVRWISTSATVLRNEKGKPVRMIGATSDITEQRKLEQNKNDFVSIATHELKTPVTSLKAYTEALERKFKRVNDVLSASQMSKMNAQLDKLTSLISDLLDATKIESGHLQMHIQDFDFDSLVAEIAEELQRTTDKHRIILKSEANRSISADRERTGQVLTNLISNAIKYSPHTEKILIKTSSLNKNVKICVQDYGVGVPKEKRGKLFERFYRISGPEENTFPGLGLGLYISSEIIKRQGGKIWVEGNSSKGSTFCFTLPLRVKDIVQTNGFADEEIKHE